MLDREKCPDRSMADYCFIKKVQCCTVGEKSCPNRHNLPASEEENTYCPLSKDLCIGYQCGFFSKMHNECSVTLIANSMVVQIEMMQPAVENIEFVNNIFANAEKGQQPINEHHL